MGACRKVRSPGLERGEAEREGSFMRSAPEDGIDCDNNTFKITGGVLIATGGSTSTPSSSVCTQYSVKYVSSASANQVLSIRDAAGTDILTFTIPRPYSSLTILFTSPFIYAPSQ